MDIGDNDELFKAIMAADKKRVEGLKASGVTLTGDVRRILENGPIRHASEGDHNPEFFFRAVLVNRFKQMPIEKFREAAALLREEIGKPLHYNRVLWLWENKRAFEPVFFENARGNLRKACRNHKDLAARNDNLYRQARVLRASTALRDKYPEER